ncbi:MAG: hypothetical protein Q8M29_09385 [Bacteroidota bacterium]|nr:hypothetical protein [Bacteroidota bacterium]
MTTQLSVLNSNQINKYGMVFPVATLESAMWQRAVEGMPMHLSHDMHRLVGWMVPYGLYFQPKLVRSLGAALIPETDEENERVSTAKRNYISEITHEDAEKHFSSLEPHIKEFISGQPKLFRAAAFSIFNEGIIERMFPQLKTLSLKDKNGLILVSELLEEFTYKGQGVFSHKKLPVCIYANPYFRKSLSRFNNFHYIFLDELVSHVTNPDVKVKISIDWDLVGYSPSYATSIELEFWFGPKYNDDISSITPGLALHKSEEFERLYYGISGTEFYWKINDDSHEFELEELKEESIPTKADTYGCRYIHSIYDDKNKFFEHFDGAIRSYDSELYMERIGMKMTEFGRRSQYEKLFRIDGKLDLKSWKSLSTNYMQGNPLIYEYFGIEKPKEKYIVDKTPANIIEELVPHKTDAGDGIRILISYHKKNETHNASHTVSICDILEIGEVRNQFLEYDVIELKKALDRLGKTLILPDEALLGYAEDLYWNIPCVFHGSAIPQEDLNATVQALKNLINGLQKKNKNKVISFTVSWNMEEKEVRISVIGHVTDLANWLSTFSTIPTEREKLIKWMEKQTEYLNKLTVPNPNRPSLECLSQFDGVLFIKRKTIGPEYNFSFEKIVGGLGYTMEVPENKIEVKEAIESKQLFPVMSCIVKAMECGKSGSDYLTSPHSKILDAGVYTIVREIDSMGAYWTDKPA